MAIAMGADTIFPPITLVLAERDVVIMVENKQGASVEEWTKLAIACETNTDAEKTGFQLMAL